MTEQEKIAELEKRIAELEKRKVDCSAWRKVKYSVDLSQIEQPHRWKLQSTASQIMCFRLGISRLTQLKDEQAPEATEIFQEVLRMATDGKEKPHGN